jgi:hypothetical protein
MGLGASVEVPVRSRQCARPLAACSQRIRSSVPERSTTPPSWSARGFFGIQLAGARDAVGREDALHLLAELGDVQGRLDDLKRRLRELAEEG